MQLICPTLSCLIRHGRRNLEPVRVRRLTIRPTVWVHGCEDPTWLRVPWTPEVEITLSVCAIPWAPRIDPTPAPTLSLFVTALLCGACSGVLLRSLVRPGDLPL